MRSKLLASVSALALAATIAACSDAPTSPSPSGGPSLDLLPPPPPPCVLVGQPTGNETFKEIREVYRTLIESILNPVDPVNENRLNCGQANALLVHVDHALDAVLNGRCQAADNQILYIVRYIDHLAREEIIFDAEANALKAGLKTLFGDPTVKALCPDLGINA